MTPNDIVRFLLEIVAVVSLAIWGFTQWPMPWPGIAFGIGAPLLAVLLWALFLSPKAVFQVDAFGRALFEIIVMGSVALAWWGMGQPIVAGGFALLATVSGVVNGRRRI
ncbi:4-amino-4-deoxy-L-arabinose transferase [Microterricola viridarii]|uniref:4-amino-4-deoxy-L-arabinose transferase n=1 Tax=Microterricola viridarii TaxID=412690 RepID=A0A0Y0MTI3_9MICO|nr:4-amino-4-deoxy-L-arabinose transferase [Microterricola viridarii]